MSTLNKYIFTLFAVCCCSFLAANANAAVCFAADGGDCGGVSSFSEYSDPTDETVDQCTQIGYDTTASDCINTIGKQIGGYCPYNSSQVMCCGLDYAYNSCAYPLVFGDSPYKCGNKLKCKCDPSVYKYSAVDSCTAAGYKKALPGGAACSYIKSVTDSGDIGYELVYKDCTCDRGLYPYSEADCSLNDNGAEASGDPCVSSITDADGQNTYYPACKCDTTKYPYTNDSCEFGGSTLSGHCVQAGIWFFQSCCSCKDYPAKGTRESGPDDPHVDTTRSFKTNGHDIPVTLELFNKVFSRDEGETVAAAQTLYNSWKSKIGNVTMEDFYKLILTSKPRYYEECPCVKGYNRFKIKRCMLGYRPSKNGDVVDGVSYKEGEVCLPISCENATKLYLAQNNTSYGLWKGGKVLYTYALQKEADGVTVKVDSTGIPLFTESQKTSGTPLIAGEVTVSRGSCASSAEYGIGCFKGAYYYSPQYIAGNSPTNALKGLKESCSDGASKINFNATAFPSTATASNSIYLYGVDLNFNKTTTVKRYLGAYNNRISSSYTTVTFEKQLYLYNNTSKPNSEKATFAISNAVFKYGISSTGYNFDVGNVSFEVSTAKNPINITFYEGQKYVGNNLYIYPSSDTYWTNSNTFPRATKYSFVAYFSGPSGTTAANVYTNTYIGYNSSKNKRARNMYINFKGNLMWNMYNSNGSNYVIGLTAGSDIRSTDYNSGNFAKIVLGSSNYRRVCQMRGDIQYVNNRHKFLSCACKRWDGDSDYYAACTIDKSEKRTAVNPGTGSKSCRKAGDCGCRNTYFNSDCTLSYQCGGDGTPGPMLTCSQ